jgi:hypothetical protein
MILKPIKSITRVHSCIRGAYNVIRVIRAIRGLYSVAIRVICGL